MLLTLAVLASMIGTMEARKGYYGSYKSYNTPTYYSSSYPSTYYYNSYYNTNGTKNDGGSILAFICCFPCIIGLLCYLKCQNGHHGESLILGEPLLVEHHGGGHHGGVEMVHTTVVETHSDGYAPAGYGGYP